MADRSSQLILTALSRAAAEAAGAPLLASKTSPAGLFPATAAGKQAAQRCCDEGYLQPADPNGMCTITDKGMAFLLEQFNPRQVLEDFVRVLESREGQVAQLLGVARQLQAGLDAMRGTVGAVLQRMSQPPQQQDDLKTLYRDFRSEPAAAEAPAPAACTADTDRAVMEALECLLPGNKAGDCPLPELYRKASQAVPGLTIGAFHDALRRLHDADLAYLHPWTGPLYELPEPPYALLVGHLVAYYASLRTGPHQKAVPMTLMKVSTEVS